MALAVVTAAALTACTGGEADPAERPAPSGGVEGRTVDVRDALQKAVEAVEQSDSVNVTMKHGPGGEEILMKGDLTLGDPVKAELITTGSGNQPITVRIIDEMVFVEIPEDDRAEMNGKSWMKMDPAGGEQQGMEFNKEMAEVDPARQVTVLLATEGVTVVGEETLDGTPTVHYTVTTELSHYFEQVDAELRRTVEGRLTEMGVKEVKIDLWVDEQHRPRRDRVVMDPVSDMTVDYTDYNKPVTVEIPPDADTIDLAR
ncbi:LppX_LprAFG lipoprotein [Micromonospora sp. NPDC047134]|uniref:LppX_LprAFG lipoprotein n=1 Tax=Micromonospora sp. NPDC047134 TaxID=3154340 RepID=UPI0033F70094